MRLRKPCLCAAWLLQHTASTAPEIAEPPSADQPIPVTASRHTSPSPPAPPPHHLQAPHPAMPFPLPHLFANTLTRVASSKSMGDPPELLTDRMAWCQRSLRRRRQAAAGAGAVVGTGGGSGGEWAAYVGTQPPTSRVDVEEERLTAPSQPSGKAHARNTVLPTPPAAADRTPSPRATPLPPRAPAPAGSGDASLTFGTYFFGLVQIPPWPPLESPCPGAATPSPVSPSLALSPPIKIVAMVEGRGKRGQGRGSELVHQTGRKGLGHTGEGLDVGRLRPGGGGGGREEGSYRTCSDDKVPAVKETRGW